MKRYLSGGAASLLLAALLWPAAAFAADESIFFVSGKQGPLEASLFRVIDMSTGEYVRMGETEPMHAIAISADGEMYGISHSYFDDPQRLFRINPATGGATLIGTLNGTTATGNIIDLTFNGNTLYGWDRDNSELATISTADASVTKTISGTVGSCTAIAWDGSTLYYRNNSSFGTINTTSGASTQSDAIVVDDDEYDSNDCPKGGFIHNGLFHHIVGYTSGSLIANDFSTPADVTSHQLFGLHNMAIGADSGVLADTDTDGVPDAFENAAGTDPDVDDAADDFDGDGVSNGDEYAMGTNINGADTDSDGLSDGDEVDAGTNPLVADTDGDGLLDGVEVTIGEDPLTGGVDAAITVVTDDDYDDLRHTGVLTDSYGYAHVFWSQYDDGVAADVAWYAMYDENGEVLIAPSLIETAQISDYPRRFRAVEFSDRTIGVVWQEDGYFIYAQIDPSEAPQNGSAVDVTVNTAFLPTAPMILQDGVAANIYATHPFIVADGNQFHAVFPDDSNLNCISYALFDNDGAIVGDIESDSTYCEDRSDPYAVLDANGLLHVAFQNDDFTAGDYEIFYGVIDPATGWVLDPVLMSDDDNEENMRPRLVAVGDGTKLMLSYGDKTDVKDYESYGGGDLHYTIIDYGGLALDGTETPSRADLTDDTWSLDLHRHASNTWYYEAARDPLGNALLVMMGHGGGTNSDLTSNTLYMVRINENGDASPPFALTRTAMMDEYGYQWFGGVSSSHISYRDRDSIVLRKADLTTTSGEADAAGIASLSNGQFLSFSQGDESTLPAAASSSLPEDFEFPDGFTSFVIGGVDVGGTVLVNIDQPGGVTENSVYFKYDATNGWYRHGFNVVSATEIQIALTDGGFGDADGMANGLIVDPGGLGSTPPTTPINVSGGGGGCVIGGQEGPFDPTLPLLALLAAGYLVRRRFTVSQ